MLQIKHLLAFLYVYATFLPIILDKLLVHIWEGMIRNKIA